MRFWEVRNSIESCDICGGDVKVFHGIYLHCGDDYQTLDEHHEAVPAVVGV